MKIKRIGSGDKATVRHDRRQRHDRHPVLRRRDNG